MRIEIVVDRFYGTDKVTIGRLYKRSYSAGNQSEIRQHQCFTLEDPWQSSKAAGNTRIPAGKYEVVLRTEGGKYQKYFTRFGDWQKPGMLWVKDVPGFEWILIHPGNTVADTEGCLLLGQEPSFRTGSIANSVDTYREVYTWLASNLLTGTKVFIEYQDNDR